MGEEDTKAWHHQSMCHGPVEPGWVTDTSEGKLFTLLSSPKAEPPPSVAFVGSEPGSTTGFVDAPHHHYIHQHQHHQFANSDHHHQHHGQTDFSDYGWMDQSHADPAFYPHQQHQYQTEQVQIADISSSSSFAPHPSFAPTFEPLSVESTTALWSGGHSSTEEAPAEYSSLSQDEIYEEIQRECAEIEFRSSSGSPSDGSKPNTSQKVAKETTNLKKLVMKRKAYSGRDSMSSLDSTASMSEMPSTGGRKERKKALNRVAATRYREKKRKEGELAAQELHALEERNAKLRADIAAVQTEMDYLKGLAAEIEAARQRQGRKR